MELDFIEPIRTVDLLQVHSCEEAILSRKVKACIRQTDQKAVTVLIDNTEVNLYPHIISLDTERDLRGATGTYAIQQIGALAK
jgi:hypothetical protein